MKILSRCLAALLLIVWANTAAAQEERAFLDLVVNGVDKGSVLVLLRGSDALVGVTALTDAGLREFGGRRERVADLDLVSLTSLAPHIRFVVDVRELRLAIAADPSLLGATVRDLGLGAPAGMVFRRAPAAFVNYALTARGRESYDLFTESALSAGAAVFYNTASVAPAGATRGITNLTFDDRRRLRRWVVGDSFGGGMPLGGDTQLGGIAVSSEFSLDPYFVRHPTLSMSTPVATPSVVEVHVNGRLVRQEQVQPGVLDLRGLPLTTGRNDTRVIVRDPFGGERELSTSYYLTTSGLAPGVHDYRYAFGWQRAPGVSSLGYGVPTALARHRVGLTNWLTAGARLEAQRNFAGTGSLVNIRLPFGELEASAGVSRDAGRRLGSAGQLSFRYGGRRASIGGSVRQATPTFTTLGARSGTTPTREYALSGSLPLVRGASLNWQHTRALGITREQRSSLSTSTTIGRGIYMTTSATHSTGPTGRGFEASMGVTMALGSRMSASTYALRSRDGVALSMDLNRALPVGTGYGFQLRGETGVRDGSSGVLQYQGEHGQYEVRRDLLSGGNGTSATIAGALVGIGGGVFATRPVRNSFALVRVPGVNGVRAYSSHQEIGRTNGRGDVLIPNLLPYYANDLEIEDSDVPLDYVVPKVEMTLAPPFRGGAVALFPVERIQRVTGRVILVTGTGTEAPVFGELTVNASGEPKESPLGTSGEFYFENLVPGRHDATVRHGGQTCAFVMVVPASNGQAVELGTITCAASSR